tara:strand:- start:249 stop:485 length:237 start_codon:yes stop_codon:yes gene_type:complete
MLPDVHKHDGGLNDKVENLRKRPSGRLIITGTDLRYIVPKYNIRELSRDTDKDNAKQLGTTGIHLYYDNSLNTYCIEK